MVIVLVLAGGGVGIAAALGAFSGDETPVGQGSPTAVSSSPDFGTGSPTAGGGSGSSTDDPTDDPTDTSSATGTPSGDYDADPPSEDDARDTMGSFWAAAGSGDLDSALEYVCPEYRDEFEKELAKPDTESGFEIDFDNSSYLGTDTSDGARSLEYDLKVTLDDGTDAELDYKVVLRAVDGDPLVCGRTFEEK